MTRQIVLDTETTGLEVAQGNRIIEIGCIELVNRRYTQNNFWHYVNPDRESEPGALQVHGISNEFLLSKPRFSEIANELWAYLKGAELLIHNATFDVGFLDMEFGRLGFTHKIADVCTVTDTVTMARKLHPGQRVSLDALCKRYEIDNSGRDLHGALLDARLLADVYLQMTGGQNRLMLDSEEAGGSGTRRSRFADLLGASTQPLPVTMATAEELEIHRARLQKIASKGKCLWTDDLPASG